MCEEKRLKRHVDANGEGSPSEINGGFGWQVGTKLGEV